METFIKYFLPVYFIVYFDLAFVAKSVMVAKRIGKNPLVIPKNDSAYGLIGKYFKFTLISIFLYVIAYPFFYSSRYAYLSFEVLNFRGVKLAGIALMFIVLIWTIIAQYHMRDSWRIGIDNEKKTELITNGLFRFSRNTIFLGMILSLLGLFFLTPNSFTLLFLILSYVLIQVQIRLEEEFLLSRHGEVYNAYRNHVRRLI